MLILSFPHVISSLSSALKSSLLHSPPADTTVVATLLSAATSVNSVKRFRCFVRHVVRHSPPLDVNSRWSASSPSPLVAVVAIVSRRRLIRLINETMPGLQIARARSSRIKSEQYCYCSLTSRTSIFKSLTDVRVRTVCLFRWNSTCFLNASTPSFKLFHERSIGKFKEGM